MMIAILKIYVAAGALIALFILVNIASEIVIGSYSNRKGEKYKRELKRIENQANLEKIIKKRATDPYFLVTLAEMLKKDNIISFTNEVKKLMLSFSAYYLNRPDDEKAAYLKCMEIIIETSEGIRDSDNKIKQYLENILKYLDSDSLFVKDRTLKLIYALNIPWLISSGERKLRISESSEKIIAFNRDRKKNKVEK